MKILRKINNYCKLKSPPPCCTSYLPKISAGRKHFIACETAAYELPMRIAFGSINLFVSWQNQILLINELSVIQVVQAYVSP